MADERRSLFGVKSPWSWITGLLVMSEFAFIGSAAVEAWRGNRRWRVKIVAAAVCCSTAFSVAIAVLVMRADLSPIITFTLPSRFTILAMAYGYSSDLIEANQVSQGPRASQERLRLAGRAADLVMWGWGIDRDIFWLNETSRARFGVGESEHIPFKRFLESLYPVFLSKKVTELFASIKNEVHP